MYLLFLIHVQYAGLIFIFQGLLKVIEHFTIKRGTNLINEREINHLLISRNESKRNLATCSYYVKLGRTCRNTQVYEELRYN